MERIQGLRSELAEKDSALLASQDRLKATESALRFTAETAQKKEDIVKDEIDHLKEELLRSQTRLEMHMKTVAQLRADLDRTAAEARSNVEDAEQRAKDALAGIHEKEVRINSLTKELNEEKEYREAMEVQLRRVTDDKDMLSVQVSTIASEREALNSELVQQKSSKDGLEQKLAQIQQQADLSAAAAALTESQIKQERSRHDIAIMDMRTLLDEKEKLIAVHRKEYKAVINGLEADNAKAADTIRELHERLTALNSSHTAEQSALTAAQERLSSVMTDNEKLRDLLDGQEHTIKELTDTIQELRDKYTAQNTIMNQMQEEASQMVETLASTRKEVSRKSGDKGKIKLL